MEVFIIITLIFLIFIGVLFAMFKWASFIVNNNYSIFMGLLPIFAVIYMCLLVLIFIATQYEPEMIYMSECINK